MLGARVILEKYYGEADFTWQIVPTQAHNYVGVAEQMIGLTKKQLERK